MIYFTESVLAMFLTHSYWAFVTVIFLIAGTYIGKVLYQMFKEEWT